MTLADAHASDSEAARCLHDLFMGRPTARARLGAQLLAEGLRCIRLDHTPKP